MSFAERYQITSTRGLVYTREMLLNAATRCWLARTSEACKRAFQAETEDVGSRARGAMSIVEMHRRQQVVCAAVAGGLLPDETDLNEDQLTVLNECWKNLANRGCIERGTVDERTTDTEAEHDVLEEA